ncbi:WD40 repeat domain-containing protein [Roseofilum capinflatum]|uniref:WD40 repeat domain-containing protein n=1 Tax=Roseofilum capinflatum BLCC-M114 TaxID=3022440 RepID=A0ABT7BAA2_9CYAN|nr:WD40 repeat domain-containing protein [Roseofilum capinflatum]MDJ1176112.1 WD40 repeat domain-containing protein [Roseofilum capinflatum BLCC-M114]
MVEKLMSTELSTKELTFQPGYGVAQFEVKVLNQGDRFASFQLEIIAAGVPPQDERTWYSLSPEVSTKKPPGDLTRFIVEIHRTPILGFVGLVNLTIRIFSLELGTEERHILRLRVQKGIGELLIQAELPNSKLKGYPNSDLELPIRLLNPGQKEITALIALSSSYSWLNRSPVPLSLPPGQWMDYSLVCYVPDFEEAIASISYLADIKITHPDGPPTQLQAAIEILPQGEIRFEIPQPEQTLPQKRRWLPSWKSTPVMYPLELDNQSNQRCQTTIDLPLEEKDNRNPLQLELSPPEHTLNPTETQTFDLRVETQRPWLGWVRERLIPIEANVLPVGAASSIGIGAVLKPAPTTASVPIIDRQQTLMLRVFPIVPRWLQGLLILGLAWVFWWFIYGQYYYIHHKGPVMTVQLNGLGDRVLSGGIDQQVRDWIIEGKKLEFIDIRALADKAVRTVKYRPVDNNQMAMGLENGEIQLWDLLSYEEMPVRSLVYQKDDRVMDLEFTPDSRYLYSGHGSGLLAKWYIGQDFEQIQNVNEPELTQTFEFAISDLAFVGQGAETLAIAGRFNQLILWNTADNSTQTVDISDPDTATGQDNYITSLATAEKRPFLLAVADNQGSISIWNLRPCLEPGLGAGANPPCELLDRWDNSHEGEAVRSIAFSADGAYLASVGDDGRLILWPLRDTGERLSKYLKGKVISNHSQSLNTVDLSLIPSRRNRSGSQLQIVTGGDDGKVRLYQVQSIRD